jgi:hypothetical protein
MNLLNMLTCLQAEWLRIEPTENLLAIGLPSTIRNARVGICRFYISSSLSKTLSSFFTYHLVVDYRWTIVVVFVSRMESMLRLV